MIEEEKRGRMGRREGSRKEIRIKEKMGGGGKWRDHY